MKQKDWKETLFWRVRFTDIDFVDSIGPDGSMGKKTADLGIRLNTLLNLLDELGLWDEYTAWAAIHK